MTKQIRVYGIVQGVGFRPTVSRHAAKSGIRGSVCNKGPYVEIFAQGDEAQIDTFLDLLEHQPPKRAAILKIDVKEAEEQTFTDFDIIESAKTKGAIFISPDIAICEECKTELYDRHDRRYLHPFINCTCCGPRLTILDALPYDRERTSMKEFPMCPSCAAEYYDPATRRYDAQPVCCNDCGPQVYVPGTDVRGREAITAARRIIAGGGIVAVKGIGGFHLCCDATNDAAVKLLRGRKTRPAKPFAVMMRNETVAERECSISEAQREILTGHQKPILLLERRETSRLSAYVAPDNPKVGVMLPYAPVQLLLFDYDDDVEMPDMLVMTSGNVSGAPICRDDLEALEELGTLCDLILSHDRKIRIRADDSVMDFYQGEPYMIRRSRGYAPLPYLLSASVHGKSVAIGGELKNTFCIGNDSLFYPSSYIGDLADIRSVRALEETVERYRTLLEVEPEVIACDLHPRYNSTMVATQLAEQMQVPLVKVQHHFAHIVSCLAENDYAGRVIGVSMDGTGYGEDGTIWGGELMLADYWGYTRIGHIQPFMQIGGDRSAREGWRIAVSMLYGLARRSGAEPERIVEEQVRALQLCSAEQARAVMGMYRSGLGGVRSTSAGRLFDAVSAILGIRTQSTFEGEAATTLQFAAMAAQSKGAVRWPEELMCSEEGILATDALVQWLLAQRLSGEDSGQLALAFHEILAAQIAEACIAAGKAHGVWTAALSGGCYQNTLLLALTEERLKDAGFTVLRHHLVPPNDGGIALGQAVAAMAQQGRIDREV